MNELDMIKLNIYESYDNGEITYGEKEYLLEKIEYIYEADAYTKRMRRLDSAIKKNVDNKYIVNALTNKKKALQDAVRKNGREGVYSLNKGKTQYAGKDNNGYHYDYDKKDDKYYYSKRVFSKDKNGNQKEIASVMVPFYDLKDQDSFIGRNNDKYYTLYPQRFKAQREIDRQLKKVSDDASLINKKPGTYLATQKDRDKAEKTLKKAGINVSRDEIRKNIPYKKESTFDLLLESINDLYYDEY